MNEGENVEERNERFPRETLQCAFDEVKSDGRDVREVRVVEGNTKEAGMCG